MNKKREQQLQKHVDAARAVGVEIPYGYRLVAIKRK